jgi:hypothetical protein
MEVTIHFSKGIFGRLFTVVVIRIGSTSIHFLSMFSSLFFILYSVVVVVVDDDDFVCSLFGDFKLER